MPNVEEIVRAIGGLETLHGQLTAYANGDIVRGAILHSDANIDETVICLDTALQILHKRLDFHIQRLDGGKIVSTPSDSPRSPKTLYEVFVGKEVANA